MTNETISYADFHDRVEGEINDWPFRKLGPLARETVIARAWEECAWIAMLTTERLRKAIIPRAEEIGK